jgi:hypothetical protein
MHRGLETIISKGQKDMGKVDSRMYTLALLFSFLIGASLLAGDPQTWMPKSLIQASEVRYPDCTVAAADSASVVMLAGSLA